MSRTVLVTGASGGIGGAIARVFAQNGDSVILQYHSQSMAAQNLVAQLRLFHPRVWALPADLTKEDQVQTLFQQAEELDGAVDVLINNAGIAYYGLLQEMSLTQWNQLMAVNLTAAFLCCRSVLPAMIRQQAGQIINISSIWGLCGASCEVAYSATKAALIGFSKALAKEAGPSGIRVNCVAPGLIDTTMNAHLDSAARQSLLDDTPLAKIGTPSDVAELVFFLASEKAKFITGQVISPNGGFVI
ncbi:MAG: 3-oxoacyl-ACP reductase FabG [Negativicutes bacterium]|nr:3-oxoacyl-ACP reductase FabG [Negativicutes bacterium]